MHHHPACLPIEELVKQCHFSTTRRGGPGGQHRNKVETAVVVEHTPTGIQAEANELRSQADNRGRALFRLRLALAVAHRVPSLASPSDLLKSRIVNKKLRLSDQHDDFPSLLAEALDALHAAQDDIAQTAQHLGLSSSQLVGLIRMHPPALQSLNQRRSALGLHPLR